MRYLKKENWLLKEFPFYIARHEQRTWPLHRHEFLEIFYVTKGKGLHLIGENKYQISRGDIFTINPEQTHKFIVHRDKGFEIINCGFMPSLIDPHISSLQEME